MSQESIRKCEFDADSLTLRLDLSFSADIPAVSSVVNRVMKIVKEMGCSEGKEYEIEASLQEALVNAIVHGCQRDAKKMVQLTVSCDEARGMLLVVRDPGTGFDPAALPDPLVGQNLFSTHGRGIYLINQLMDEVKFQRGGTEIHMRKK